MNPGFVSSARRNGQRSYDSIPLAKCNHTAPCAVKRAGVLANKPSRQTQQARLNV
jgi:hypothetical protein